MTINSWQFGVRIGRFWSIDQIIGLKIASYSYITTKMEVEQRMELLKAIKEMMDANQGKDRL
jgi:hypothetical protein